VSWIHISGSATGSGNQFVNYTVDANPGASRPGGIMVSAGSSSMTVSGNGIASYDFFISANNGVTVKLGTANAAKMLPSAVSVSCNNVLNKIVTAGSTTGAATLLVKITLTLTPTTGQPVTSSPTPITLFFGATRPCGL
jgi:hypothetical protein